MTSLLRALFRGVPLGCLVFGGAFTILMGSVWWAALGLVAAGAIVIPKHLSGRSRELQRVASVSGALDPRRLADLTNLSDAIASVQGISGAEQYALQLREQFEGANAKYLTFRELLSAKFDPGEITFGRYLKSAEHLYFSVLDEAQNAATSLAGLQTIDLDLVRARTRALKRVRAPSDAEVKELEALETRLELREKELGHIRELLSTNEQSLTTLALAGTALTRLQTEDGRTALDADTAMQELEELASRTNRYSLAHTRGSDGDVK